MSLIQEIFDLMAEDDADLEEQSAILERVYDEACPQGKAAIDNALTAICGYTMESLRERMS